MGPDGCEEGIGRRSAGVVERSEQWSVCREESA